MDTQIETKLVPAKPTLVVVDFNRRAKLELEIERQGFTVSKRYPFFSFFETSHSENNPNGWSAWDVQDICDETFGDLVDAGLEPGVLEVNATPESVVALDREIMRKRLGAVTGRIGTVSESEILDLELDGVDEETIRDIKEQIEANRKKEREDSDYMEDLDEPDTL